MVEQNSAINNRSLFQVFVDNLKYPAQMERLKMQLHTFDSPKVIKQRFSDYLVRLERKAKRRMDAYFDELIRACEVQEGM